MTARQHFWTTGEDRVLHAFYAGLGPAGIADKLPGRSYNSIVTRACTLNLKFAGPRAPGRRVQYQLTPDVERELRALYQAKPVRGAVKRLAQEHGVPSWWMKRQAAKLGISRPAQKDAPWSDAEDRILDKHHGRAPEYIQKRLRAAGCKRTLIAIVVHRKRRGLSCRPDAYYTANEVAKMLGLSDAKSVTYWINAGWLKASRMRTNRTERQGGDFHWVHHDQLRAFVIDNPHHVDLRKIPDTEWFIHLVAGRTGDGRQHRRKKSGRGPLERVAA